MQAVTRECASLMPKMENKLSYFQVDFSSVKALGPGEVLVVPIYHVFGSEELSVRAPGIAALCPAPYLAVNPDADCGRTSRDIPFRT